MKISSKIQRFLLAVLFLFALTIPAMAQSDVSAIVTGAETTFSAVATLCVAMGIFFIGYRIAKRVR